MTLIIGKLNEVRDLHVAKDNRKMISSVRSRGIILLLYTFIGNQSKEVGIKIMKFYLPLCIDIVLLSFKVTVNFKQLTDALSFIISFL